MLTSSLDRKFRFIKIAILLLRLPLRAFADSIPHVMKKMGVDKEVSASYSPSLSKELRNDPAEIATELS
jgi:hypothetical protein